MEIKRRYEVEGVDKNGCLLPRIKADDEGDCVHSDLWIEIGNP